MNSLPARRIGPLHLGLCGSVLLHLGALWIAHAAVPVKTNMGGLMNNTRDLYIVSLGMSKSTERGTRAPSALSEEKPPSPEKPPAVAGTNHGTANAVPPEQLDSRPVFMFDPDYSLLDGLAANAEPIRLRLYVDESGKLQDIGILHEAERDSRVGVRLRAMFSIARFLPGRKNGRYVSSYMDIEIEAGSGAFAPIDDTALVQAGAGH
ncbi:MAG TPA: hypothetical protein VF472_04265 [Burkholderiaceae bacterium]